MSHANRVRAGKKAARTRKRNLAIRREAWKKGGRKAARRGRKGLMVRRTKVRATVASVRRRGRRGKGRLVFLVPKRHRKSLKGRRWAKQRIRFNMLHNPDGGFVASLKSLFTLETVQVVGGGLVGFSVSAGLGEAAARAVLKGKKLEENKTAYVLVGLGTSVVVAAGGGAVISRWYPTLGRAFFWGGLLGAVVRAMAAMFPGKGYDMPKTKAEADKLAMVLAKKEAEKVTKAGSKDAEDWIPGKGSDDYLMSDDEGVSGDGVSDTGDYLNISPTMHPALSASGGGQQW